MMRAEDFAGSSSIIVETAEQDEAPIAGADKSYQSTTITAEETEHHQQDKTIIISQAEMNDPTKETIIDQIPTTKAPGTSMLPFSIQQQQPDDYSMLDSLDSVSLDTRVAGVAFSVGDHVFQWCTFMGIQRAYSHHAIVVDVFDVPHSEDDPLMTLDPTYKTRLRIVDFTDEKEPPQTETTSMPVSSSSSSAFEMPSSSPGRFHKETRGCVRVYETDATQWRKVSYNANFFQCRLARSGTCTQMKSDPPRIVKARAEFLLQNPSLIPYFNSIHCNCEGVALWCKTGQYRTLQASSWLGTATAAGPAKSAVALAGLMSSATPAAAAATTATAAGEVVVATAAGSTAASTAAAATTAAAAVSPPLLLPTIAACGIVATTVPLVFLVVADHKWKNLTSTLNEAFWNATLKDPDLFVDCLEHWSQIHESSRAMKKALKMKLPPHVE